MALQGNLREFSATDILQLLGTQKKTGCLTLESRDVRINLYVQDGRLVATRAPGMSKDDPLLRFLLRAHRLSNEQYRGILTIQRESNRDLEDLLVNGRYLEAEELGNFIERQVLDDLMQVTVWEDGSYAFDPNRRWPNPPLARLSVEGALIEIARRVDEQRRFTKLFADPHQLIGVRDLPNADDHLSEEECDLFGIIDGRHTVAEIVEAAPLSIYEAYEALQRMMEAGWIEGVGRRDPGTPAPLPVPASAGVAEGGGARVATRSKNAYLHEAAVAIAVLIVAAGLAFEARALQPPTKKSGSDAFAAAEVRDLRYALELYRRQQGRYPERLENLITMNWVAKHQLEIDGSVPTYRPEPNGGSYRLELTKP